MNHVTDLNSLEGSSGRIERFNPFICLVSFLMNLWPCSMMLLRYFTCKTSISQNQPLKRSAQFTLFNPARLAPLLSITTLSGKPLCWIARLKNAVAALGSLGESPMAYSESCRSARVGAKSKTKQTGLRTSSSLGLLLLGFLIAQGDCTLNAA